jgi:hypothetical protein
LKNISRETVTGYHILYGVCQLVDLNIKSYFILFFHSTKIPNMCGFSKECIRVADSKNITSNSTAPVLTTSYFPASCSGAYLMMVPGSFTPHPPSWGAIKII